MRANTFFHALNQIDDAYLDEAIHYTPAKKRISLRWAAAAACLCVAACIAIPMARQTVPDEHMHSAPQSMHSPVYKVVNYNVPASYAAAELHIATTGNLDAYDAHMEKFNGAGFAGKGIRVFSFAKGTDTADAFNVWYFARENGHIARIYAVTESNGKFVTAHFAADELGRAIESLAEKTSHAEPMYLVHDDEMIFAVIGETAYYLPGFTSFVPQSDGMPAIDFDGAVTRIITLP